MVDIFDSEWLIRMMDKSSNTPQGRILSLFDILQDWLDAPNIKICISHDIYAYQNLITFIEKLAVACNAVSPNHLAIQVVVLALKATFEEMNHPGMRSLSNAKIAGNALLIAHTQNSKTIFREIRSNHVLYGIAATLVLMIVNLTIWLPVFDHGNHSKFYHEKAENKDSKNILSAQHRFKDTLSAIEVANMYDKYEQLRKGICQYPEVLSIPDKDRAIYLDNVVGGQLPKNIEEMKITNTYLEMVNCYYSPFLGV